MREGRLGAVRFGGLLSLVLGLLLVLPAGAAALTGDWRDAVLTPSGNDITGPAETILTNPTFLDSEPFESPSTRQTATRALSRTGLLATASKVIAPLAAAATAYEVCNAFLDGCFLFEKDTPPPANTTGATYTATKKRICSSGPSPTSDSASVSTCLTIEPDTYYTATPQSLAIAVPNDPQCGGSGNPAWAASVIWFKLKQWCYFTYDHTFRAYRGLAIRPGDEGVGIEATTDTGVANATGSIYCPASTGTCSSSPNPAWSNDMADLLQDPGEYGLTQAQANALGEAICEAMGATGCLAEAPGGSLVEVPNCEGLLWSTCADQLSELELVPARVELDWQGAIVTKPADAVVGVEFAGAQVEPGTGVTVTTNPDEAGMPIVIPARLPGESYQHYTARLTQMGLESQVLVLPDNMADEDAEANEVLAVDPAEGTRLEPGSDVVVDVIANPDVISGGGGVHISSPDLSPLGDVDIPCTKFPFGIFCWVYDGLGGWGNAAGCGVNLGIPFGESVGLDNEKLAMDLCQFEPAMAVVRPIIGLLSAFTLAWLFAATAMGLGQPARE